VAGAARTSAPSPTPVTSPTAVTAATSRTSGTSGIAAGTPTSIDSPPSEPARRPREPFALHTAAATRARLWILAGAVVATLGIAIFSLLTLKRQSDTFAQVPDAIEARRAVRLMVLDALAAESAQRGYLLTGNRHYLDELFSWDPHASMAEMRRTSHGLLEAELVELEAVLAAKHREMLSTLELYDSGDREGALKILSSDLGKDYMKRARAVMSSLISYETRRVDEVLGSALVISQVAMPLIIGGTGLTIMALLTGFLALRNSTRSLAQLAQKNARQATRLEETSQDLKASLEAATQTNRALMLSNRDLDQFAYVASHDLKAPLRGISSLSTWIEDDLGEKIDDKTREHLRLMRVRIERMSALIEGILGYSRAGREVELTEVNMYELVGELRSQLAAPPGVDVEILPGPWPVMKAQRVQLTQVWQNLLANAMKHGVPGGGRIQIGCGRQGAELCFWVKDSGPGIPAAYHKRIFDLFQRLVSRDRVEGAGIGLSIVRKLVDGNGGRIWIESAPGEGTTFKFTWSAHDAA
jgi:signal transduction histidine kinase